MENLSNISRVKEILSKHGFRLKKSLGQNFLIDDTVCPRMADSCGVDAKSGAIEIGPGIGVLTRQLAQRAQKVISIEIDQGLRPVLAETMGRFENVKIIYADVLKMNLKQVISQEFGDRDVCVCANLPYYITSPVIMHLLESRISLKSITVMVQKEAAQRICAMPGTRESGAISVGVHYRCVPRVLFNVSKNSFVPPPSVDSAVIRLDIRESPPVEVRDEDWLFRLARSAFSQRRKTAANSISSVLKISKPEIESALEKNGISKTIRAERMQLSDFALLSDELLKFSVKI